jgi:hypothetical protein
LAASLADDRGVDEGATVMSDIGQVTKRLEDIRNQKLATAKNTFRLRWGSRKPVFGDTEQIMLLRQYRFNEQIAEREFEEAATAPRLREFGVSFDKLTVYAFSADEAEAMAAEEATVALVEEVGDAPEGAEEGVDL